VNLALMLELKEEAVTALARERRHEAYAAAAAIQS
jgi:hypothetical protein